MTYSTAHKAACPVTNRSLTCCVAGCAKRDLQDKNPSLSVCCVLESNTTNCIRMYILLIMCVRKDLPEELGRQTTHHIIHGTSWSLRCSSVGLDTFLTTGKGVRIPANCSFSRTIPRGRKRYLPVIRECSYCGCDCP